jgi:hypothetical protein
VKESGSMRNGTPTNITFMMHLLRNALALRSGGQGRPWSTLDKVRDRVPDMVLIHGGDTKGVDRLASSWAERRGIAQVTFSRDMRLDARAGFKRNGRMLSLDPR